MSRRYSVFRMQYAGAFLSSARRGTARKNLK
nr:MAG TPA: hypothetical protein [Caudoviricetes sp.]